VWSVSDIRCAVAGRVQSELLLLIRQRREIAGDPLHAQDLARFIREAIERAPIFAVSIQSYEPLLPVSRKVLPHFKTTAAGGRGMKRDAVRSGSSNII
jgi:hypothetical protein